MSTTDLRIDRTTVRLFEADTPLQVSFGSLDVRRMCLVEIEAGGLVGRGESWINWPAWSVVERVATFREGVFPLLAGADALDREAVLSHLIGTLLPLGRQWGAEGPIWQAISAVDVALWDLQAQVERRPITSLLSATPVADVPVYASGVGPTDVTMLLERALHAGFTAAKLKIGFGRERDEAILTEARAVVGDTFTLFTDANRAWTLDQAVEMAPVLAGHGVSWCEEPLEHDAPSEMGRLYDRGGLPLALGENVYGVRSAAEYIAQPGIVHLQPDLCKTGGITMMRQFGALTEGSQCRLTPHSYGSALSVAATAQCAATLPQLGWVELDVRDNPYRTDVRREPMLLRDGRLPVPEITALSDVFDMDALERFEVPVS
ncbi:MAG: mandelate racemase/muconate lactonizing enzyme family protein [Acidimicrobiales bacterium]